MILVRPVARVILNAASLASVPELVKKTRASPGGRDHGGQPLGQRDLGRAGEEVRDVAQGGDLAGDRRQHGRVRVPQRGRPRARTADRGACARPRPRRGHPRRGRTPAWGCRTCSSRSAAYAPAPPRNRRPVRPDSAWVTATASVVTMSPRRSSGSAPGGGGCTGSWPNSPLAISCGGIPSAAENTRLPSRIRPSWVTIVPIPALVKISSSRACGTRPSVTVARVRPPSTARRHASIFGSMPDSKRRHQRPQLGGRQLLDHRVAGRPVGVETLDVGEHDQTLRAQRDRQGRRGGVGVDVVHVAVQRGGDAGHHRHPAGSDQPLDGLGVRPRRRHRPGRGRPPRRRPRSLAARPRTGRRPRRTCPPPGCCAG